MKPSETISGHPRIGSFGRFRDPVERNPDVLPVHTQVAYATCGTALICPGHVLAGYAIILAFLLAGVVTIYIRQILFRKEQLRLAVARSAKEAEQNRRDMVQYYYRRYMLWYDFSVAQDALAQRYTALAQMASDPHQRFLISRERLQRFRALQEKYRDDIEALEMTLGMYNQFRRRMVERRRLASAGK